MDRKFKHVESGEIFSAYEEGVKAYYQFYKEQVERGDLSSDTPFDKPPKGEAIEQGLTYFEDNEEYIEITL